MQTIRRAMAVEARSIALVMDSEEMIGVPVAIEKISQTTPKRTKEIMQM